MLFYLVDIDFRFCLCFCCAMVYFCWLCLYALCLRILRIALLDGLLFLPYGDLLVPFCYFAVEEA